MDVIDKFAESKIGSTIVSLTRVCMKGFGLVLSLIAVALFSLVAVFYFLVFVPLLGAFPSIPFFINSILGLTVGFSVFFNYFMCIFTSPGS